MEVHAKPMCVVSLTGPELRIVGLGLIGHLVKEEDQRAAVELNAKLMRQVAVEAKQFATQADVKAELAAQLTALPFDKINTVIPKPGAV